MLGRNYLNKKCGSKQRKLFDDLKVDLKIQYSCEECNENFTSLNNLKIHTYVKHLCLECLEHFKISSKYQSHREETHESFYCNMCPNKIHFPSKIDLVNHYSLCHGEFLEIWCSKYDCWYSMMEESRNMRKKANTHPNMILLPITKTESKIKILKGSTDQDNSNGLSVETRVLSKRLKRKFRRRRRKRDVQSSFVVTDMEGVNGEAIPHEIQQELNPRKLSKGPQSHLINCHLQKEAKNFLSMKNLNICENTVEFKVTLQKPMSYKFYLKWEEYTSKPIMDGKFHLSFMFHSKK